MVIRQKDIAKILGLTKVTVSRALNDSPLVSEETKKKVRELSEALNYQPDASALRLQNKGSKVISIMRYSINSTELHSRWLVCLQREARMYGYSVRLDFLEEFVNVRAQNVADGYIIFAPDMTALPYFQGVQDALGNMAAPILLLDCAYGVRGFGSVVIDNYGAVQSVMEHLYCLGHRRIAFLGLIKGSVGEERCKSYLQFIQERDLPFSSSFIIEEKNWATEIAEVSRLNEPLLTAVREGVTAIVAASDVYAVGAIRILKEEGYKIPKDISISGFDNSSLALASDPELTSVDQNLSVASEVGMLELIKHLETGTPQEQKVVKAALVIRKSTGVVSQQS